MNLLHVHFFVSGAHVEVKVLRGLELHGTRSNPVNIIARYHPLEGSKAVRCERAYDPSPHLWTRG